MGISIAIEGSEGAGKSTLAMVTKLLLKETTDFPIKITREPGGTILGEMIRGILRGEDFKDMNIHTNMLLYSAARAELYYKVEEPFLEQEEGGILIKDRSWLSTAVFQVADGISSKYVDSVQGPFSHVPDKFAVVDIPVLETLARIKAIYKDLGEREEDWRDKQTEDKFETIRRNYLSYVVGHKERCTLLDCFDDPWEKAARIKLVAVSLLSTKEGNVLSREEKTELLTSFVDEAIKKLIFFPF